MKTLHHLVFGCVFGASALVATAVDLAPNILGNTIFNGTITGSTGGKNGAGAVNLLFTNTGLDYSLDAMGAVSDPVAFIYTKTSPTTATIAENGLGIALTYTAPATGTFVATYTAGGTQTGTFMLAPFLSASPITNMSTLTSVSAGGGAITGVIIGGVGPQQILIRAVGPGLAPFGVSPRLADPRLTVYAGNQVVANNDNWDANATTGATLQQSFTSTGAFNLPAGSNDAAILLTLNPGAYTAVVQGGSASDAGAVIIELFQLQ